VLEVYSQQSPIFIIIPPVKIIIMLDLIKFFLITLLYGEPAKGEMIPDPTFRSSYPENRPDEQTWVQEVKFGSRYGHKGSFYTNNSNRSYF
jgi:hypothetical protein